MRNGYKDALEAAGAAVLAYESFGSYQGDWWAKVRYNDSTFWVHGCFGSCSVCDAFEGEFGWHGERQTCYDHEYDLPGFPCMACEDKQESYRKRLVEFGKSYLDDPFTHAQALAKASENLEWDMDASTMVKFLNDNA